MEYESKFLKHAAACAIVAGGLALSLSGAVAQNQKAKSGSRAQAETDDVARGRYLVENVAMCEQCHTPRDSNGALDERRPLDGAPVFLMPASPNPDWPLNAPRIGGTPPASDADMVRLLTTGVWTTGKPLRFPMMPFRMSDSDAKAVVAYLRSVRAQP